ncbi:hypothetical protein PsYK624_156400 [Phanerochaete sordida]|uniref:Uncharacterized protein n=1 Tax=Phanerochaete sordida TaxID=48140 RepID=A0A9P3LLB5_9APHY|nr:hypothetical protein PsYK624_156400 [Phanerochaete sordida]
MANDSSTSSWVCGNRGVSPNSTVAVPPAAGSKTGSSPTIAAPALVDVRRGTSLHQRTSRPDYGNAETAMTFTSPPLRLLSYRRGTKAPIVDGAADASTTSRPPRTIPPSTSCRLSPQSMHLGPFLRLLRSVNPAIDT